MGRLYALCDIELLEKYNLTIEDFIKISKRFNAQILQYRDKKGSIEEKRENILFLKKHWDRTLIINDEVALSRFCDGVHIGQEDLLDLIESFGAKSANEGIYFLRKIVGKKIIGLSTHSKDEILIANSLDIDYIGLGAYRTTSTKDVATLLGDRLSFLAKFSKHKVAAIGGVRVFDNIDNVYYRVVGSDLVIKALTYA